MKSAASCDPPSDWDAAVCELWPCPVRGLVFYHCGCSVSAVAFNHFVSSVVIFRLQARLDVLRSLVIVLHSAESDTEVQWSLGSYWQKLLIIHLWCGWIFTLWLRPSGPAPGLLHHTDAFAVVLSFSARTMCLIFQWILLFHFLEKQYLLTWGLREVKTSFLC